jgi:hypothetical protein
MHSSLSIVDLGFELTNIPWEINSLLKVVLIEPILHPVKRKGESGKVFSVLVDTQAHFISDCRRLLTELTRKVKFVVQKINEHDVVLSVHFEGRDHLYLVIKEFMESLVDILKPSHT